MTVIEGVDSEMTIDGESVRSSGTFDVVNPSTGAVFATAPECTPAQLDAAMRTARTAFMSWQRDDDLRRASLLAAADVLFANTETIGRVITAEQGKPLSEAMAEVAGAGVWFKYFARFAVSDTVIQDDTKGHAVVRNRPLGVVAAITPWNYPIFLAAWKLAPALRAGNSVVLKPSPYTPLSTLLLGELLRGVFPAGVLNVVTGGNELGAWMTTHPTPRKVSFTGSVETGKAVAVSAATDLKRVTLELGGNDPAIILPDADITDILSPLFWGAFINSGQACAAVKRLYVPDNLYDEVVDGLADLARSARVGDGLSEGVQMGPVSNAAQADRVEGLLADAVAQGARVAAGGSRSDGPGYFFEPTILANVREGVRVVDEEQFGPLMPVIRYSTVEEVVERANATMYGLAASVWGSDVDRADEVARSLECGTTWINSHLALSPNQPFGGAKWSGLGVENGHWGLEAFSEPQVIYRPAASAAT